MKTKQIITEIANQVRSLFPYDFSIFGGSVLDLQEGKELKDVDVYINVLDVNPDASVVYKTTLDIESALGLNYDGNYTIPGVIGKKKFNVMGTHINVDFIIHNVDCLSYMEDYFDIENKMLSIHLPMHGRPALVQSDRAIQANKKKFVSFNCLIESPTYEERIRIFKASQKYGFTYDSDNECKLADSFPTKFGEFTTHYGDVLMLSEYNGIVSEIEELQNTFSSLGVSNAAMKRIAVHKSYGIYRLRYLDNDKYGDDEITVYSLTYDYCLQRISEFMSVCSHDCLYDNHVLFADIAKSGNVYIDEECSRYILDGSVVDIHVGTSGRAMFCVHEKYTGTISYVDTKCFRTKFSESSARYTFNTDCGKTFYIEKKKGYYGEDRGYSDDIQIRSHISFSDSGFSEEF